MIKYAVLMFALVATAACQGRPPYAGSSNRYPQVLPRFQDEERMRTSTTGAPQVNGVPASADVANRVGEEPATGSGAAVAGNGNVPSAAAGVPVTQPPSTTAATTPRADLPVLALGDADLVDRIMSWPEDARPFWVINKQQIDAHLHPRQQPTEVRPAAAASRSFFAG